MTILKYEHHGQMMSVQEHLKGKHREHCLCYQGCRFFKPGTEDNCPIAQHLYRFNVKIGLVTPVWECSEYKSDV